MKTPTSRPPKSSLNIAFGFPTASLFLAGSAKTNSPLHHALHGAALNEALGSSRIGSPLSRLDAERERTLIYCSQLAEAKDRSLRGADVADVERAPAHDERPQHDCRTVGCRRQAPGPFPPAACGVRELHCCVRCYDSNGERHSRECDGSTADLSEAPSETHRPSAPSDAEAAPVIIPPGDVLPVALASAAARPATRPAGSSANVVPPDVTHACPIPGCRRRPLSDPRGLQQISQDLCCGMCMFSNGENHTAACDSTNRASTIASSSTPSSGGDSGGNGGSSTPHVGAPTVHHLCRIQGCVRRATDTEHGSRTLCCDQSLRSQLERLVVVCVVAHRAGNQRYAALRRTAVRLSQSQWGNPVPELLRDKVAEGRR